MTALDGSMIPEPIMLYPATPFYKKTTREPGQGRNNGEQ